MLQLGPDVLNTERQKFRQSLPWIRARNTLHKLVDCAHSVGAHVVARVVEDHVEHHVVEWL